MQLEQISIRNFQNFPILWRHMSALFRAKKLQRPDLIYGSLAYEANTLLINQRTSWTVESPLPFIKILLLLDPFPPRPVDFTFKWPTILDLKNPNFFQVRLSIPDNSTRLVDSSTQTDTIYCCHKHQEGEYSPKIPEKHSVATSTCIEDEDDESATRKRKEEILKDDKKLYLMFGKDETDDQKSCYLYRRSDGEKCTYYYSKSEDRESKSDLSSFNDNKMSPMMLSTSSLDVSIWKKTT